MSKATAPYHHLMQEIASAGVSLVFAEKIDQVKTLELVASEHGIHCASARWLPPIAVVDAPRLHAAGKHAKKPLMLVLLQTAGHVHGFRVRCDQQIWIGERPVPHPDNFMHAVYLQAMGRGRKAVDGQPPEPMGIRHYNEEGPIA